MNMHLMIQQGYVPKTCTLKDPVAFGKQFDKKAKADDLFGDL